MKVCITSLALVVLCLTSTSVLSCSKSQGKMVGGTTDEHDVTKEVQDIVDKVKPQAEEKLGENFDTFTGVTYKSQVVAGTNYFVKINVGGEKYIHARIFVPLPYTEEPPELVSVQANKGLKDPVNYF